MRSDTDGVPDGPVAPSEKMIKDYTECPMAFDQMIISLTQYFNILNINSMKLEDLWLNILEVLGLDRPNKYTVFSAVHHQCFRNIVLKDPLIQQVIREVEAYADSGMACMNPRKHLDMIYAVRRNCSTQENSYCDLAEQGIFSEALRQLIEYLFDEVMQEQSIRPSQDDRSLVHSEAQPALKPFE